MIQTHRVMPLKYFFITIFLLSNLVGSNPLSAALGTRTEMPEFVQIAHWLNTEEPLTKKALENRVVLIDFWNYSNWRSLRRIEVLNQWYERYRSEGLVVVGVLTPTYEFEKNPEKLKEIIQRLKIFYPVALDTEKLLINTYNPPSPTSAYLIDGNGSIRKVFTGELDYEQIEKSFQELLHQTNPDYSEPMDDKIQVPSFEVYPNYEMGYKNLFGYGNDIRFISGVTQNYPLPSQLSSGSFYLTGNWSSKEESLEISGTPGSLIVPHTAKNVYMLAASASGLAVPAEIRLDNRPLDVANKGKDIVLQGGKSYLFIEAARFYEVLKQPGKSGEYRLEIRFEEPGAEIYKMSFE